MTDSRAQERSFELFARGRALAAAAGALATLLALCFHVPVWVATVRGAIAFAAVWLVVIAAERALALTARASSAAGEPRRDRTNR